MDTNDVMSVFLRGMLGIGGRKRASRATHFLSANRGFLSASTLLAAAGVAWGIYDSLQPPTTSSGTAGASGSTGSGLRYSLSKPAATAGATMAAATPAAVDWEVVRLVRLAVSAAHADGALSAEERALILQHAREAGIAHLVEQELAERRPLAEIVAGVSDLQRRQDLFVLAFTIVRADEQVTGGERIYLAQLAHRLGLDAATAARLEQETVAKIDAPEALDAQGPPPVPGSTPSVPEAIEERK